jgi:chemotaxis protein MotB
MHGSRLKKWCLGAGWAGVVLLCGCANSAKQQAEMLTEENRALRDQLAARSDDLAQARQQLRERDMEVADLRRVNQGALSQVTGFEQIPNVSVSVGAGEVTVEVESDVLFASGKTTLRQQAKSSLDEVASVLRKSYPGHAIRVEGHTDTDPIRKSGYKSNHHLGFERAYVVREYLVSRGLEPGRVALASYGPDRPRETKAASRRVQIVVAME